MKLYMYPGAPSPRRVELMLKYKGIMIDTQTVDIRAGEQLGDDFQRINPRCTVPALALEDGSCLSEVIAICVYLDSQYPEKSVFGSNEAERAQVINWMHRIFTEGFMAAAEALRNASPNMKGRALPGPDDIEQIPELAKRGIQRLNLFMQALESGLQNRDFLVGDRLSQADIDAYVILEFAGWVKVAPPDTATAIPTWKQRVAALVGE